VIWLALLAPFAVWALAHWLDRIERSADRAVPQEHPLRVWAGPYDWSARGEL